MNRRSTATMAALLLDRPGAPSGLRSGQAPVPAPGPGQVLVRVEAGGLNPVDYKIAAGGMPEWSWPHILGADVVGRVESVGEGVGRPVPGDRIAYHGDLRTPGGFADFAITTADTVALVPSGVDAVTAAALPCAAMTAHQAVSRRLHVRAGQTVLVTAGAGGVGGFAVQLAARVGARVIATASAANADHVRHLGAETVLDYRSQDIPERVRRLTDGRGVDAVVDAVSPVSATSLLPVLAFGGGIAAVAGRPDLRTVPSFTTAPSVHEIALGAAHSHGDAAARADLATMLGELLEWADAGLIDSMIADTLRLDQVPAALTELAGRHVRGKLVWTASR